LNIKQLQKNLGGATRERALEIGKHVFHMLCTVVPSAKQQSFAAHNLADFAIATFDDQPISLANAFEQPVVAEKNSGYRSPSIDCLVKYSQHMKKVHGLGSLAVSAPRGLHDTTANGIRSLDSFPEVEEWIAKNGPATAAKE
jgi:CRISPR system Cascade subunit CasC